MPGGAVGRFLTAFMAFMVRRGMRVQGRPLLVLTTKGARTGAERRTILGWFEDPADPSARLIVASNSGSKSHPAWFFNLASHPDAAQIEIGGVRTQMRAATLAGQERAEAWKRIVAAAPGYGRYETSTDREIPVVRLTPR